MTKLILLGFVALATAHANHHPVNEDMVKEIKAKATTWTPMEVAENPLSYLSPAELKKFLGTNIVGPQPGYATPEISNAALPTNFDSRTQWADCIHPIRNQAQCGSCWAFAATEAFSDRLCIDTKVNVILSPEDLVECDSGNMGCNGGWLNKAWDYLSTTGAVSDACLPYTSGSGAVTQCPKTCTDKTVEFKKYKCSKNSVVCATNEAQIQSAIYAGGPMETGFTVYQDFFNYKSGVYKHVSGGVAGGHAVKMLGWGVEGGQKYWLCANSWGADWGLAGFFKIAVGDSGIDQAVYGCTPEAKSEFSF